MNYRTSRNKRLLVELTIIQLSQSSDGSDDVSGQGPARLKPIFNREEAQPATVSVGVTQPQQDTATVAPQQQSTYTATPQQNAAPTQNQAPVKEQTTVPEPPKQQSAPQPNVLSGRPATMKRATSEGNRPFGGMFQRTHTEAVRSENNTPATNVASNNIAPEATVITKPVKSLNQENLSQKWFEFAVQLPVNERALGDRMKIIAPELREGNSFVIKVDNQLVKELFTNESKRIVAYIEEQLACGKVTMKIELNEQQVQRRIYNRTEQFKLLTEKNPALEKLRQALNLDFA